MKCYARAAISEFLGDRVVYRNLDAQDASLPRLTGLAPQVGLPVGRIPRKTEADYARVVKRLLELAQAQRGVRVPLKRLLFVGDTRLLDGTAYDNLCAAGGWPGLAFIGSENSKPAAVEVVLHESGQPLYLSNRWAALSEFDAYAAAHGLPVDESTAVVVDIDKTALGARGRNGQVIDQARVQAVQNTVASLLGAAFDLNAFRSAYDLLNQPEFHPFTTDNQDYLAYVCLILGSGLTPLDRVVEDIREKRLASFEAFLGEVDRRAGELSSELSSLHADIFRRVQAGDPTPFKSFRRNEYRTTIGCFGNLGDDAPIERLLAEEILVTHEVHECCAAWNRRGALLFGLSDKPDEAATPTAELAAQGFLPIHRAQTHTVGA
jgi:hypothetical protein